MSEAHRRYSKSHDDLLPIAPYSLRASGVQGRGSIPPNLQCVGNNGLAVRIQVRPDISGSVGVDHPALDKTAITRNSALSFLYNPITCWRCRLYEAAVMIMGARCSSNWMPSDV